jgi:uncharacterized protein YfaS (alpha-2-macroglobulin family)
MLGLTLFLHLNLEVLAEALPENLRRSWIEALAVSAWLMLGRYFGWTYFDANLFGLPLLLALAALGRQALLDKPAHALRGLVLISLAVPFVVLPHELGNLDAVQALMLSGAILYMGWESLASKGKSWMGYWLGAAATAGLGTWLERGWGVPLRFAAISILWFAWGALKFRERRLEALTPKSNSASASAGKPGAIHPLTGLFLNIGQWAMALPAQAKPWLHKAATKFSNPAILKRGGKLALGCAAAVALFWGGYQAYLKSTTTIVSFTPSGEVASPQTVIQAVFSSDVEAQGDLKDAISVEPALPGRVFLADKRTLIFSPEKPLSPATQYEAHLNTVALKSGKWRMASSASTHFNTPDFKVEEVRLFYDMDVLGQTETELVGELNFNYPLTLEALKQAFQVSKKSSSGTTQLHPEFEAGSLPTRFYFKASGFTREDKVQTFVVSLDKSLKCTACQGSLESTYEQSIELPARPEMTVEELKLHQVPGNSMVAVRFSLPITNAEARASIRLSRQTKDGKFEPVPMDIDSEYAYALLKAKFEPNTDYKVTVEGIRATTGQVLKEKYEETIKLEDAQPYVRFADAGHYLPEDGSQQLEIRTMNLDDFNVSMDKIYRNNIVLYLAHGEGQLFGRSVYDGKSEVKGGRINEEVSSRLDLKPWHAAPYKGLFNVSLRGRDYEERADTWLLCTDIGLLAKRAGKDLWVQAMSIQGLSPQAGVLLELYERKNQVLASATTDAQGRAFFKDAFTDNADYEALPFVVVASKGEDYSFLRLDTGALETARFDTGGDSTSQAFDGFLTTERGLYRPGESAHLTAIARKANLETLLLPLKLEIDAPDGSKVFSESRQPDAEGMATYEVPFSPAAATGAYQAKLTVDPDIEIATTTFKVEEFIPNKIQAEVRAPKEAAMAGGSIDYSIKARHLFGAPASNLRVKTAVQLEAKEFSSEAYPGYHFSDPSRTYEGELLKVPEGNTDASGNFPVTLDLPSGMLPASMLSARIIADVFDDGGRPVGAFGKLAVHRYSAYIGLKGSKQGNLEAPARVSIQYVVLDPSGKIMPGLKGQHLVVKRRTWYSIFRRAGFGGRGFESSYYDEVVENRKLDLNSKGSLSFQADKPGEYTVLVGDERSMRAGMVLSALGASEASEAGASAQGLENADRLSMSLDKATYKPGESAMVEVNAPFPGRLFLSVERDSITSAMDMMVPAGHSRHAVMVQGDAMPNAYVVGLLVRQPDEKWRGLPMCSFGVIPLPLDTSSRTIGLSWQAPDLVRSMHGIEVDLATGEPNAEVVLAAVDEGVLQIISFQSPDPFKTFYRKRRLATTTMALFNDVLPDLQSKLTPGGDDDEGFVKRHLNPVAAKKEKSFARFSGLLKADDQGRVHWKADTEGFQGQVRVMAMAVKGKRFGSHAYDVRVADPIVLQASLPRFAAPQDRFDVPVMVFNTLDKAMEVTVTASAEGPVGITAPLSYHLKMEAKGQQRVVFHARAELEAGVARFAFQATGGGESASKNSELAIRPAAPLQTKVKYGILDPGQSRSIDVPSGYIRQGRKLRLHVSANPMARFLGSLDYLLRYPYGCGEQLSSQLFPLLAFKDLGLMTGRFDLKGPASAAMELDKFVASGIRQLCALQDTEGGFRLWPGDSSDNAWLTNYASQCLLEASRQGYEVPGEALARIRKRLGAIQVGQPKIGRLDRREKTDEEGEGFQDSYMLYLRALAGTPDVEGMKSLRANEFTADKGNFFDRCLLSLAFSASGDPASGLALLPASPDFRRVYRDQGGRWDSSNRDLGAFLMALSESGADPARLRPWVDEFARRLGDSGDFGNTQDNAWAFMGLGKAVERLKSTQGLLASYTVGDEAQGRTITDEANALEDPALFGKTLKLKNDGSGPIYYILLAEGTPLQAEERAESEGIDIRREYRDESGKEVNPGSVTQGELVVVTLRLKSAHPVENPVLVDLLPGGFEVDNPRLQSQGHLGFTPETSMELKNMDFRDDRVLLFPGDLDGEQTFSYSVRAVTPGDYNVPPAFAEAMYDPQVRGRSKPAGHLVVAPVNE